MNLAGDDGVHSLSSSSSSSSSSASLFHKVAIAMSDEAQQCFTIMEVV